MDRSKFDKKSLEHYDASVHYFQVTLIFAVLALLINALKMTFNEFNIHSKAILMMALNLNIALLGLLIISFSMMIAFCYDYYIGQNRRKEKD